MDARKTPARSSPVTSRGAVASSRCCLSAPVDQVVDVGVEIAHLGRGRWGWRCRASTSAAPTAGRRGRRRRTEPPSKDAARRWRSGAASKVRRTPPARSVTPPSRAARSARPAGSPPAGSRGRGPRSDRRWRAGCAPRHCRSRDRRTWRPAPSARAPRVVAVADRCAERPGQQRQRLLGPHVRDRVGPAVGHPLLGALASKSANQRAV